MSFILDALKKSEETRNARPEAGQSRYIVTPAGKRKSTWPQLILLCALIVCCLGMGWWFGYHSSSSAPQGTHLSTITSALPQPTPEKLLPMMNQATPPVIRLARATETSPEKNIPVPTLATDHISAPLPHTHSSMNTSPVTETTAEAPAAKTTNHSVVDISELPQAIRRQLPELKISLLFYSPDAGRRLVRIDGLLRHEGEALSAGLRVQEIQEQAILLTWQRRVLRLQHGQ